MDWDKLRIFHVVAQAGSFTHAGERLNLSQSAISRQISALEQDLGLKLFTRHARGLVLTAEGDVLNKTATGIYAQISSTKSRLFESKNEAKGELRVACSIAFGGIWLPKRLKIFTEMYPHINVCLVLTDKEVDLTMREADMAISYGHVRNPHLVRHFLANDTLQMYGNADYFADYGVPRYIEDLDYHKLIVYGTHTTPPYEGVNWLLKVGAQMGRVRDAHITVNNAFAILQCVRNGLGIGALPYFMARDYPDLISPLPEHKGPSFDFYIMYPEQLKDSKKVQVFKDFITAHMAT